MLKSLFSWLHAKHENTVSARELSAMSDRELADIGLCRSDIPMVVSGKFADAKGVFGLPQASLFDVLLTPHSASNDSRDPYISRAA